MRIGFDASPLAGEFSPGVARVAREILARLEARGVIDVVRFQPPPGVRAREFRKELPALARSAGVQGLHVFASFGPKLKGLPVALTVHELPWLHGVTENAGWKHRLAARASARRAERLIVPTEFVAADLRSLVGRRADRIRVVAWGFGPPFDVEPPPGTVDESMLERYRLSSEPFLLAPGATRRKKRLDRVLHGLARSVERLDEPLSLVVTGPSTKDLERDLGLASQLGLSRWVSTLGDVPDDDLAALMRLAVGVPVLSESEGFALPVLEALACGTPVIVPHGSAQAEVAGTNALLVDPDRPDELADAFAKARRERERQRYPLAASVSHRTWDATAEAIEAVWKELVG